MNLSVLSSSTGIACSDGTSYVEMLDEKYNADGIWINGFTVISARKYARQFIKGNNKTVIIHLGAVECFSRPVDSFIIWCIREMGNWCDDPTWIEYLYHKLIKAAMYMEKKEDAYIQPLESYEFKRLYEDLLIKLEGCKIVVVGMSKPARVEEHWINQASQFNDILKELSINYNTHFIDTFSKYEKYVEGSNHLNSIGHKLLFDEIDKIIKL